MKPRIVYYSNVVRLLKIILISCIVYWPVSYFMRKTLFEISYLLNGTFTHLWFLISMVVGFTFIFLLTYIGFKQKSIFYVSLCILLYMLLKDSYANLLPGFSTTSLSSSHNLTLMSIPFISIGMFIEANEHFIKDYLSETICMLATLIGILLSFLEVKWLMVLSGYPQEQHEFVLGSILMALGIFGMSISIRSRYSALSYMGYQYSLFIYIYHFIIIIVINYIIYHYFPYLKVSFILPIATFLLSIMISGFIKIKLPIMFSILTGDYSFHNAKVINML